MNDNGFSSAIVQKSIFIPGLHGLRGIAALAIVFYHLTHLTGIVPPLSFAFIGRDFGYGVHLFFILSAFSLTHSTEPLLYKKRWVDEYLIKRFFRIAPLFYCMIFIELARQLFFSGRVFHDFSTILLNFTFTFGFVPFSGFVWGGWSVGVEMIFYAFFPVLILVIRSHRSALLLLIISFIASYCIRTVLHAQYLSTYPQPKWDWSYFSFASNMCFFAMGLYAYHVSRFVDQNWFLVKVFIPAAAVLIIGSLLFLNVGQMLYNGGRLDIAFWGIGLMALCIWQSLLPSYLIANKFFEFLGERSFSIYLLHPMVIFVTEKSLAELHSSLSTYIGSFAFFACAAAVIIGVLAVAELAYRLIEVPGIRLGRRLILKRRQT